MKSSRSDLQSIHCAPTVVCEHMVFCWLRNVRFISIRVREPVCPKCNGHPHSPNSRTALSHRANNNVTQETKQQMAKHTVKTLQIALTFSRSLRPSWWAWIYAWSYCKSIIKPCVSRLNVSPVWDSVCMGSFTAKFGAQFTKMYVRFRKTLILILAPLCFIYHP